MSQDVPGGAMNAENYFISLFASKSRAVGDDGAVCGEFVYSKDAFFENIHFKRSWMGLGDLARRAMMVNVSDAVAMNATPRYALLAVGMPKGFTAMQMRELQEGFESAARYYGLEIVGGDTISNPKLDISVTVVSQTRKPLLRKGLKPGHCVAHTGSLGRSAKELRYLLAGGRVHSGSKFRSQRLRSRWVAETAGTLSCGMDISDGLFSDMEKLGRANALGFRWLQRISKRTGCSGEEYEMLVGFDPRKRRRMLRLSQRCRVPLNIVATARRGRYACRCKAHHF